MTDMKGVLVTIRIEPHIAQEDIERLGRSEQEPRLSLFMPAHPAGPQTRQDPIRFKNLLDEAERRLSAIDADVDSFLADLRPLHDDTEFWRNQDRGLAILASPEETRCWRLSTVFEELVVAGPRYHILPLVSHLTHDQLFYVVVVSQDELRVLECVGERWHEVDSTGLPQGREVIQQFIDAEKSLQFQTTGQGSEGSSKEAAYHGHGGYKELHKTRLHEYFRTIDEPLSRLMPSRNAPVVFAGVDYLQPIFRDAVRKVNIADDFVAGNYDEERADLDQVHSQALEIVRPIFRQRLDETVALFSEAEGSGRTATSVGDVITAAQNSRVHTLLVQPDGHVWGGYDPVADPSVTESPERGETDEDLLNVASILTLSHGGRVHAIERDRMPVDGPLAAIYRY